MPPCKHPTSENNINILVPNLTFSFHTHPYLSTTITLSYHVLTSAARPVTGLAPPMCCQNIVTVNSHHSPTHAGLRNSELRTQCHRLQSRSADHLILVAFPLRSPDLLSRSHFR